MLFSATSPANAPIQSTNSACAARTASMVCPSAPRPRGSIESPVPLSHPRRIDMRAAVALSGATLLAGALIGGTAWAQEKKPVPVTYTLNWYPQAEHGGLFHAKADGIYERYGLDVTLP